MLRAIDIPRTYSIAQLSEDTGFSKRMIRWYVSAGILPPANGRGPTAFYTDEHLRRLRAIQRERENRRTAADWRECFSGAQA